MKARLKGKNLACFCKLSDKCHADVLLKRVIEVNMNIKELIEKLKDSNKYILSSFSDHEKNLIELGINCSIGFIEEYQKEQEKLFDPELLGFKLKFHSKEDNISEYESVKDGLYRIRYFRNENKIWVLLKHPGDNKSQILTNLIKVPNHAFGVDLLKNLGVIE